MTTDEQIRRRIAWQQQALFFSRNKTTKELDELFAVTETSEQKATVRLARKWKREREQDEAILSATH